MYWLQPPPHLRRVAAVMLLVGAFLWDLRGTPTEAHPFARVSIPAGDPFAADAVEWRRLPEGSYAIPSLEGTVAAVDLAAGDPIVEAVVTAPVAVPEGWWAVALDVGTHPAPGESVLLVVVDPPASFPGLVVSPQQGDRMSLDYRPALVAVPGTAAPVVAAAAEAGLLVTAVQP